MKNVKAKQRSGEATCTNNLQADTTKHSNQIKIGGAPAGHFTPTAMKNLSKRYNPKLPTN